MTVSARFLIVGFFALSFVMAAEVFSQTTPAQLVVTWRANESYVPSDYQGKALPTPLSSVVVRVGALQGGRFLDLSNVTIRWYVDEYAVTQGVGVTEYTIEPALRAGKDAHEVRVELLDLGSGGAVSRSVSIPLLSPRVVIRNQAPDGSLSLGVNNLVAVPYYFGVGRASDLNYGWTMRGTYLGEDSTGILDLTLDENFQAGERIELGVTARSFENEFDQANDKAIYIVR